MKENIHEHNYNLSFTGLVGGTKYYYYRCTVCDDKLKTTEPIKPEAQKGFYEGNPLTKI